MPGKKSRADANVMRLVRVGLKAAQDNVRDQAVAEARAQWTTKWAASSNSRQESAWRMRVTRLAMENENIKRVRQHSCGYTRPSGSSEENSSGVLPSPMTTK